VTTQRVGRKDIHVIPNFVDTELFHRRIGRDCAKHSLAPHGEAVLLHISNFRPVKRIMDVIEVFRRVLPKHPSRLVFVGDGPELSPAERFCFDNGLMNDVLFLGRQDNFAELLPCADVLLLPSELESFGLVGLEAMSCEVPVVATRVGGIPEVVQHGETGYLAELGDVDTMAEYALQIVQDPELGRRLGRAGRERAIEMFDQRRIVPLYEEYYEQVLRM